MNSNKCVEKFVTLFPCVSRILDVLLQESIAKLNFLLPQINIP
jgi:hypothetical protein